MGNIVAELRVEADDPESSMWKSELLTRAAAEIERLHEAKRSALSIADEGSKENVALRAQVETKNDEAGWLIETGDHKYWNGKHANADGFTSDANDAVRFSRFEDSERVIYWLMQDYKVFLVSRQHMWHMNQTVSTTEPIGRPLSSDDRS